MEQRLDNAGTQLWSSSQGAGTPLILCNGGPGCDDYLSPVSAMIEDLCKVVRFEPRGCGRSDHDKRYDLQTTIGDIEFIRRTHNFGKIIVAGHSAGVDLALAYTIQYPQNTAGLIGIAGGRIVNDREWHKNVSREPAQSRRR